MIKNLFLICRPHQWIKNILIFVPLISSQQYTYSNLLLCIEAIFIFSLISSAGYIINDIFDKKNDLLHPIKKNRPIASGKLNNKIAIIFSLSLLFLAFCFSYNKNIDFILIILSYIIITSFYSSILKKIFLIDILIISFLFLLRINAGSAIINVETSIFLHFFSIFFFISLATIKRIAEIRTFIQKLQTNLPGRSNKYTNINNLKYISYASFYLSLIVLIIYIVNVNINNIYENNILLFIFCPIILLWFYRIIKNADNGNIEGDPIIFAIKDKISLIYFIISAIILFLSV